jgi:uncharacterized phage protein gp47/JayE
MALSWLGRTTAERQFVAAVQASANANVDASQGSFTLALGQAAIGAFLWLQGLIAKVVLLVRAATSTGSDLDSWFADWFFTRLAAVSATGLATFSRATTTQPATVSAGQQISTGPNGTLFFVTIDTTNAAWNATANGYVINSGISSVTVPISAVTAGSAGNVLANTITSFVSPIPGIDTVTNAAALTNGADAETDQAFRARFQLYLAGLRRGTVLAIKSAVANLQQGVLCTVLENVRPDLSTDSGYLTVLVDDGTGTPPTSLITNAFTAIDAVRAAGIRFAAVAPTVQTNTVSCTVVSQTNTTVAHAADVAAATAAITNYINSLLPGATLYWARLWQVAFNASPNIIDVTGLLLNGATADVTANAVTENKAGTVTVS